MGLEPMTFGSTNQRSNLLSYIHLFFKLRWRNRRSGIRTHGTKSTTVFKTGAFDHSAIRPFYNGLRNRMTNFTSYNNFLSESSLDYEIIYFFFPFVLDQFFEELFRVKLNSPNLCPTISWVIVILIKVRPLYIWKL